MENPNPGGISHIGPQSAERAQKAPQNRLSHCGAYGAYAARGHFLTLGRRITPAHTPKQVDGGTKPTLTHPKYILVQVCS